MTRTSSWLRPISIQKNISHPQAECLVKRRSTNSKLLEVNLDSFIDFTKNKIQKHEIKIKIKIHVNKVYISEKTIK